MWERGSVHVLTQDTFSVHDGQLWMSLAETVVMGFVSLSSGCGDLRTLCMHGRREV